MGPRVCVLYLSSLGRVSRCHGVARSEERFSPAMLPSSVLTVLFVSEYLEERQKVNASLQRTSIIGFCHCYGTSHLVFTAYGMGADRNFCLRRDRDGARICGARGGQGDLQTSRSY